MKRSLCVIVAILGAVATTLGPANRTVGHAAEVSACVEHVTWTFSTPLTTTFVTAQGLTFAYNTDCAIVSTTGSSGIFPVSGTIQDTYTGSCTSATFSGPGSNSGLILGGKVVLMTGPVPQVFVLDTTTPCADSSTSSVGVGIVP